VLGGGVVDGGRPERRTVLVGEQDVRALAPRVRSANATTVSAISLGAGPEELPGRLLGGRKSLLAALLTGDVPSTTRGPHGPPYWSLSKLTLGS
jgi:hypothetical protein